MSKGYLRASEDGKTIIPTGENTPVCSKCLKDLKNNEWVFFCEISKNIFCEQCLKSKEFRHFDCSVFVVDHTDFYGVLKIEKVKK